MDSTRRMSSLSWMLDAPTNCWKPSQSSAVKRASIVPVALASFSALFRKSTVAFSRLAANFSFRDSEPSGEANEATSMADSCLLASALVSAILPVKPVTFSDFSSESRNLACWIRKRILASWASWMTRWNLSLEAVGLALAALAKASVAITPSATLMSGILMLFLPIVVLKRRYSSDLLMAGTYLYTVLSDTAPPSLPMTLLLAFTLVPWSVNAVPTASPPSYFRTGVMVTTAVEGKDLAGKVPSMVAAT